MDKNEITTELLADLKGKAEKATKGIWENHPDLKIFAQDKTKPGINAISICHVNKQEDKDYIAAANPAVMLAMIAKIEQLEKEADWLADKADESGECLDRNCPQRDQFLEHELYKEKCITCWRNAAKEAVKANE